MSGGIRKRDSKWDWKEDSRLPHDNVRKFSDKRSPRWSFEDSGNNGHRLESIPVNRGGHDNDNYEDGSYDAPFSPGPDDLRKHRHNSPKNEWNRPRRSGYLLSCMSCLWTIYGRSRSRSRSPVRGYRREPEVIDRSRSRSAQICKDYAIGRCRRGNHCHFLHPGNQNYEDNWESRDRKAGSSKYSVPLDSRDYPIRSGRSAEICVEFEKGNCQRGASCRSVHSIEKVKGLASEVIGERERDMRNRDVSFEQGAEREPPRRNDIPCKFFAAGNCRNGKYCRFSHDDYVRRSPDRRSRDDRRMPSREKLWGSPKWTDSDRLPDTHNDHNIPKWTDSDRLPDTHNDHNIPKWTDSDRLPDTHNDHNIPKWTDSDRLPDTHNDHNIGRMNVTAPEVQVSSYSKREPIVNHHMPFENDVNERKTENLMGHTGVSVTEPTRDTHNWIDDEEMSPGLNSGVESSKYAVKEEDSNHIIQSSQSLRLNDATVTYTRKLDMTQRVDHMKTQPMVIDLKSANTLPRFGQSSQGFSSVELNQVPNSSKPDIIVNTNTSQANPGIPPAQNAVSNVQLNQLNEISASLAQFFENKQQQLPQQLYATLNSQNGQEMPSLGIPPTQNAVQPNEVQKQYDPVGLKSIAEENSEIAPKSVAPNLIVDGEESSGGQHDCATKWVGENINDDDKAEEGKKSKDVKGTRLFKFALVEFVKELLKPSWKGGQIGKEDYKNIVKKAVDKVTGTIQGASVPQTQDKIDQYLSNSKPKITKLVQAYVEKFQKGVKEA
ncbi:zinc finger CCCH domain-containing protein 38 [Rutidosis leptorrhynchoides]|uniref:zinc finger CCCH domain-containing protein 38 n=1 Tax=Rutidosis leptorrhynchoides TaxID=125765 RepID=UPI003A98D20D